MKKTAIEIVDIRLIRYTVSLVAIALHIQQILWTFEKIQLFL
jgi:hypothetical protein